MNATPNDALGRLKVIVIILLIAAAVAASSLFLVAIDLPQTEAEKMLISFTLLTSSCLGFGALLSLGLLVWSIVGYKYLERLAQRRDQKEG